MLGAGTRLPADASAIMMPIVSVQELEKEVKRLSPSELAIFSKWFKEFIIASNGDNEHSSWNAFSAQGLARAYSDSEPGYTPADIKRQ